MRTEQLSTGCNVPVEWQKSRFERLNHFTATQVSADVPGKSLWTLYGLCDFQFFIHSRLEQSAQNEHILFAISFCVTIPGE